MTAEKNIREMGAKAKDASHQLCLASTAEKNCMLRMLVNNLLQAKSAILTANREDIALARSSGMTPAMLDRLSLEGRLEGIIQNISTVIDLPDPIGEVLEKKKLPNGLLISKRRVPLGVLGVIYESRPEVTIDVAALAIKTGNCAILRGGSETMRTNTALVSVIQASLTEARLPEAAVQLIDQPDRSLIKQLLHMHEFVDVIIPRGGENLHAFCRENSRVPVITGGIGVCHLFVDESADLAEVIDVVDNAKRQRPTVCNALDTLLIHQSVAKTFLPRLMARLNDVSFRLDERSQQLMQGAQCKPAEPDDWNTEWLSLVLGIKIVDTLQEAINHIHQHSTGHSDGILTENPQHAEQFVKEVDSACVYVNASTRFTDGSQLGLGTEVAISTQKLHARGPMGLGELTTYKWVIEGSYHKRK
ncbi:MAG: glutamate-5-semialdehyde dehydrogenase [Waddliaceae bacterium]